MNTRQPIPLRPAPDLLAYEQHRSLVRAATALALAAVEHRDTKATALTAAAYRSASEILARTWPHDRAAEVVLRGPVLPTMTSNATAISVDAVAFLASMAPQSAAARLFEKALRINLAGIHVTNVARLAAPAPSFVAEGDPIPVVQGDADSTPVGPVFKLPFIVVLSEELQFASPENASVIIGRALADAVNKQLDVVVFDNVAGAGTRPSGLLNGVTPLTATAGSGVNAMASDLGNLAGALSDAGVDAEAMVIVANARQATKLRLLAGPAFSYPILGTSAVAAGTVIGIAPAGVASGFDGAPRIEASKDSTLHMNTAPAQIGTPGTPNAVAAPTRSLFQTNSLALKVRTKCAWSVVHPGAVAQVTGATW